MIKLAKKQADNRYSSVPLYKQIKEILINEMQMADGESGRPFSIEQELVGRFHNTDVPVLVIETKLYTLNDCLIGSMRAIDQANFL